MTRTGLYEAATLGLGQNLNLPLIMKSIKHKRIRLYARVDQTPKSRTPGIEFVTPGWLTCTEYGIWLCSMQTAVKLLR